MPEYLAPGVYVEETSYRAKSIEGVATSTCGFVGQCRFGPTEGTPVLITSFEEFQRHFGGLEDLNFQGVAQTNYVAHAVRAFFENGGKRVYVSRIFNDGADDGVAEGTALTGGLRFRARFPGLAGNVLVRVSAVRSGNLLTGAGATARVVGVRRGDIVEMAASVLSREIPTAGGTGDALTIGEVRWVETDDQGNVSLTDGNATVDLSAPGAPASVQKISLTVEVISAGREDAYGDLSTHPDSARAITRILRTADPDEGIGPPPDRSGRVFLQVPAGFTPDAIALLGDLLSGSRETQLTGGNDGALASSNDYVGGGADETATGLVALGDVDDIAIVAAPGGAALDTSGARQAVRNALVTHCENLRYRFAVLSAERNLDVAGIREVRAQHDSTYAGLYYPWVTVTDPFGGSGDTLALPPDGFVAGIFARSDIERGVHKAPANEVVRGALRFSRHINKGTQDVLNPEGINCLRFLEGRGYRLWGARTITSDPEWTYVNVRRLFIFLEHSIDKSTQWAVFEPNNEALWLKIRLTIESFLTDVWRTGALMGTSPDEAFFVRCDRTTMTQGDLDNGRLVCLIGVAPTKPAEFVIFRIGQWTADASIV